MPRRGLTLVALALAACGAPALPPGGTDCGTAAGARVATWTLPCPDALASVMSWKAAHDGWAISSVEGWSINFVQPDYLPGHSGMTYHEERRIDVSAPSTLLHELEHARLGPASDQHCDWISDGFVAYEDLVRPGVSSDHGYVVSTCPNGF